MTLCVILQKRDDWPETEKWLQQRFAKVHSNCDHQEHFGILGYQWRTLRFNDDTRQSTVKVMAAYQKSKAGSVFFMQQADCLAVPCKFISCLFPISTAMLQNILLLEEMVLREFLCLVFSKST